MYSSQKWLKCKKKFDWGYFNFFKKTSPDVTHMLHKKSPSSSTYNSYINDNMENHIDLKRYK